jgi:hypothetical protein
MGCGGTNRGVARHMPLVFSQWRGLQLPLFLFFPFDRSIATFELLLVGLDVKHQFSLSSPDHFDEFKTIPWPLFPFQPLRRRQT